MKWKRQIPRIVSRSVDSAVVICLDERANACGIERPSENIEHTVALGERSSQGRTAGTCWMRFDLGGFRA